MIITNKLYKFNQKEYFQKIPFPTYWKNFYCSLTSNYLYEKDSHNITHCSLLIVKAQWILQSSFTNDNLYDVEFYNRNTGWAVGDGGTILKTINGGNNWINVPNPAVGKPLSGIHIVDSNICYVVGWFETIIKSTNGGNDWVVIRNGPFGFGSSYEAVFFADENTGWIAGTGQKVLRTTNGGDSIITTPLFTGNIHDMYFKDSLSGIITGSGLSTFKTSDGGVSWYNIVMPIGTVIPTFYKISFVDNLLGWVAGSDNRIFKTADFGETWDTISKIPLNPQSVSMHFAEFIDEYTGFVGGELGYLYKSTNGGFNWSRENTASFPPNEIISMFLHNDLIGWMVGGEAKIFFTTTGGQTMVGVSNTSLPVSDQFTLYQNYPNPFNPVTFIKFSLRKQSLVKVKIYNVDGREVRTLIDNVHSAGDYQISFNASDLNSGIYLYTMFADGVKIDSKRMIYLK